MVLDRPSKVAVPARELAEDIQDGATVAELAARHSVTERVIMGRLREAGYDWNTGLPLGHKPADASPRPLVASAGGSGPHVGGGDHDVIGRGLPTDPARPYRQRPRPTGLDWPALANQGRTPR